MRGHRHRRRLSVRLRILIPREKIEAITDATTATTWLWPIATLLVLDRDPRTDATALLAPAAIYVRGQIVSR